LLTLLDDSLLQGCYIDRCDIGSCHESLSTIAYFRRCQW
jgi:hypothetical protein